MGTGGELIIMGVIAAASAAGTIYSSSQQTKAQEETNAAIAARYAAEEKRRKDGKEMDKTLAAEIEGRRQERMKANKDDIDQARQFAVETGTDTEELRQGVRIQGAPDGAPDA